jgi:hypothetical protein
MRVFLQWVEYSLCLFLNVNPVPDGTMTGRMRAFFGWSGWAAQ